MQQDERMQDDGVVVESNGTADLVVLSQYCSYYHWMHHHYHPPHQAPLHFHLHHQSSMG